MNTVMHNYPTALRLKTVLTVRSRLLSSLPPKNMLQRRWCTTTTGRRYSANTLGLALSQTNSNNSFSQALLNMNNSVDHGMRHSPFLTRDELVNAKRVVIKLGSAVVTRADGQGLALGRLAAIIEQVSEIQNSGAECILVTSGAVAFGKQRLSQELLMSMSMRETLSSVDRSSELKNIAQHELKRPNAAVGQSGLMALYEAMFRNYGILVGQVLVTKQDFRNENTREQLFNTIRELMALNIIPVINTNDAVSPPPQDGDLGDGTLNITDNDSLACTIAVDAGADLAILMSDVEGIYNKPPKEEGAQLLPYFNPKIVNQIQYGEKSNYGTGGMESKVKAACYALEHGCSVVICSGMKYNTIRNIMSAENVGTMFTPLEIEGTTVEIQAQNARKGSRRLSSLAPEERAEAIRHLSNSLLTHQAEIMEANNQDLANARAHGVTGPMFDRLALSSSKLESLCVGLNQIADSSYDNVGRVLKRTKISETLEVVQETVPIGVLMVIFESRPDALPQIAALAIASANGLLLKGGKEATNSNRVLIRLVNEALGRYGCADAITLVSGRNEVSELLKLDGYIDLIIPRGSNELVRSIKERSKSIPVLGHADGICHVYLDSDCDVEKAIKIVVDAKTDYPAACNAMETLLIHESLLENEVFYKVCQALKQENVKIYSGPRLSETLTFGPPKASKLSIEYGDLACTIEIVSTLDDAIDHIHKYGSSHTDVIVTENQDTADRFLNNVDSACVFHNVSSRFADGFRLGLGAEVGISTGRIHARGPVGVEGLLTTKWVLRGTDDTAEEYSKGRKEFIHKSLPLN
ncbi:delta-1-pyrroline-5-carboxylate synthase isoform X4 [Eurytemora carolleeae]|nr:delta-1-pyrroline-5-carboxylate synthase isoform X4 [Eurytemora carolleeae]|eukprot:XP_023338909.1 delta-1-pyrroline-5-carboxylate synthase-like isoform X4 [Eurytemora affinis]